MGAGQDDMETGLGMVDIWHWELDCGPGEMSGGGDPGDGDDPDCNLDDEYATDPEERDDDDSAQAENSLAGSWSHTAGTVGGAGTWIFEMSRPLSTGDPHDAQFTSGGSTLMAIAYWDPKESVSGWSDAGHLTSADDGWIEVSLPAAAAETPTSTPAATPATTPVTTPVTTPAATSTPATTPATTPVTTPTATATITVTALPTATPAGAPDTGGPPGNNDNSLVYVLLLLGALAVGLAVVVIYVALPRRGP
jgi:cell division septation protein DedD